MYNLSHQSLLNRRKQILFSQFVVQRDFLLYLLIFLFLFLWYVFSGELIDLLLMNGDADVTKTIKIIEMRE